MRILFLSQYYYWWDRPRAGMLHLAMSPLGLRDRGHDVKVICTRRPGQVLDDDGIDVHAFTPPLPLDVSTMYADPFLGRHRLLRSALVRASYLQFLAMMWRESLALTRTWRPDIIYCQTQSPGPVANRLAHRLGVPLVVHTYGGGAFSLDQARNPLWRANHYLDIVSSYRADADAHIVADDGTRGDLLARELGVPESKIHHWSIPVARPSPAAVPSVRSRLGIPDGVPVSVSAA